MTVDGYRKTSTPSLSWTSAYVMLNFKVACLSLTLLTVPKVYGLCERGKAKRTPEM